jgi:hypothetical protein
MDLSNVPNEAAVYALCTGKGKNFCYVYVGHTTRLRDRIKQHLVARDSSINISTASARLNPDRITEVLWWQSDEFERDHKPQLVELKAAELVAFHVLDPILRSNSNPDRAALKRSQEDDFKSRMEHLFDKTRQPDGRLDCGDNLILTEIDGLRKRIERLESRLDAAKL